jgi:hypothetical protein
MPEFSEVQCPPEGESHEGKQAFPRILLSLSLNIVVLSLQTLNYAGKS